MREPSWFSLALEAIGHAVLMMAYAILIGGLVGLGVWSAWVVFGWLA